MKVILTQDVPKLGSLGEVINIKDGHARNFLIPKGTALVFNAHNLKIMESRKKKEEFLLKRKKEDALALSEKLKASSCTIAVKAIDEDKIFGSVTTEMIQKAFEAEGVSIDKKAVQLEEPIKKLGVYQIPIKLHPEVIINCKVWIVKE
ncbi:MAG: 50S ribosomal protein L9 [Candidatus Omnitrophica bacterium]|nr:50S ribosomal protein L9 [Candidatus Omnitrophota bacterium]